MSRCLSENDLAGYHARELAESEIERIERHLHDCAACARRSAAMLAEHTTWVQRLRALRSAALSADALATLAPPRIPGYEILGQIRRGGQGIVFRALQESTKREVALKVLREGPYATDRARRHFEREIELAAALDHPHIVTIFDSGRTADGHHYFAMNYIRGQRLDLFVSDPKVTRAEKLKLLSTVCKAVNHAHLKGIIHRDLKPSNILVDEAGEPHVLDFGLARQRSGAETMTQSMVGEVAGTLPYMSPEQARGSGAAVDVRSDVYALGVMLYGLITGEYPYPIGDDVLATLKHIADTPPVRPSRVLRHRKENRSPGPAAGDERPRPERIDDELDTIVLKALAKDPDQRYESAGRLAQDIDHYLAGEPIEAKRNSSWYLLRKLLYRHRVGTALAAMLAMVVLAAAVVSTHYWRQAVRDRDAAREAEQLAEQKTAEAQQQAELAERRFRQVRELAEAFIFQVDPEIKHLPGAATARRSLVDMGLKYLNTLAADAGDHVNLKRHLAGGYVTLGDVQGELSAANLGDLEGALACYHKAQDLLQQVAAADDNPVSTQRLTMLNLLKIGDVHANRKEMDQALEHYQRVQALAEQRLAAHPDDEVVRAHLSAALGRICDVLQARGDLDGALRHNRRYMHLLEEDAARRPNDPTIIQRFAVGTARLGQIEYARGNLAEALEHYQRFLAHSQAFADTQGDHFYARRSVAIGHQWLGIILSDLGRQEEALVRLETALAIQEELASRDPEQALIQEDITATCIERGEAQLALRRYGETQASFERAVQLSESLTEQDPQRAGIQQLRAVAYQKMGEFHLALAEDAATPIGERRGHWTGAREWYQQALDLFNDLRQRGLLDHEYADTPEQIHEALTRCADALAGSTAPAAETPNRSP